MSIDRKFLYADGTAYAFQHKLFIVMNRTLTKDMAIFVRFCKQSRLVPNISQTVVTYFHLNNKIGRKELCVTFDVVKLRLDFGKLSNKLRHKGQLAPKACWNVMRCIYCESKNNCLLLNIYKKP